jgi:tellurite methyltransferase
VNVQEYFDVLYGQHERYWWREEHRHSVSPTAHPTSLLTQFTLGLVQDKKPGRALDLGAGEGADSIRLARLGFQVDAIEVSPVAAEKISRFAAAEQVDVRVVVADIRNFVPARSYDVVICNGVLHYVGDKEPVIRRMQAATNAEGLNVISLWSNYTPVPDCHNYVPVFCDDEYGLVYKLYDHWYPELIYFDRDKIESAHTDLEAHRHSHIKLIARKAPVSQRR